jgi:diguanylate cyclase (GGDEF)-like protein
LLPEQEGSRVDSTGRLPRMSIAREATVFAQRLSLFALGGMLLIVSAFVVDRVLHTRVHEVQSERLYQAERAAGNVLLADERLSMSAYMAASTGEQRWIARYDESMPAMDAAIALAMEIAPAAAGARFRATTSEANDRLVELERQSFVALRAGDAATARRLLEGDEYQRNKRILGVGTKVFLTETMRSIRDEVEAAERRAQWSFAGVFLAALALASLLWWLMARKVMASGRAFHQAEHRIKTLALHDALTGLPNRVSLEEALRAALSRARRRMGKVSVLMIDLDGFKPVNDRFGHEAGDRVLREVARRLQSALRDGELCGRHGGDEFVVVIEHGEDPLAAVTVADRISKALEPPISLASGSASISASIGIATFPDDAKLEQDLLRHADLALYEVKRAGGGRMQPYASTG